MLYVRIFHATTLDFVESSRRALYNIFDNKSRKTPLQPYTNISISSLSMPMLIFFYKMYTLFI